MEKCCSLTFFFLFLFFYLYFFSFFHIFFKISGGGYVPLVCPGYATALIEMVKYYSWYCIEEKLDKPERTNNIADMERAG